MLPWRTTRVFRLDWREFKREILLFLLRFSPLSLSKNFLSLNVFVFWVFRCYTKTTRAEERRKGSHYILRRKGVLCHYPARYRIVWWKTLIGRLWLGVMRMRPWRLWHVDWAIEKVGIFVCVLFPTKRYRQNFNVVWQKLVGGHKKWNGCRCWVHANWKVVLTATKSEV